MACLFAAMTCIARTLDGHVLAAYRFRTVLAVPIIARDGAVLGALNLHERRDGQSFSDEDQRLAEAIAHHAAVALERARLITELQAHADALEAHAAEQEAFIHTVSHALKTPLSSILAMGEILASNPAKQAWGRRAGWMSSCAMRSGCGRSSMTCWA